MSKRLIIATLLAAVAVIYGLQKPHSGHTSKTHDSPQQTNKSASEIIGQLTRQQAVVSFLQQHQRLPAFYLTKKQARHQGWQPDRGNLCQVLPGRAIGGDRFGNREKRLPDLAGRQWFEADINYHCGKRGRDRVIYSNDGLIYVTNDHYQHVKQVSG